MSNTTHTDAIDRLHDAYAAECAKLGDFSNGPRSVQTLAERRERMELGISRLEQLRRQAAARQAGHPRATTGDDQR